MHNELLTTMTTGLVADPATCGLARAVTWGSMALCCLGAVLAAWWRAGRTFTTKGFKVRLAWYLLMILAITSAQVLAAYFAPHAAFLSDISELNACRATVRDNAQMLPHITWVYFGFGPFVIFHWLWNVSIASRWNRWVRVAFVVLFVFNVVRYAKKGEPDMALLYAAFLLDIIVGKLDRFTTSNNKRP